MDEPKHLTEWAIELAHFLKDWWFIVSGVMLITVGSIWWSLHRWFVSHEKMALCKEDLSNLIKEHERREFARQDQIESSHKQYRDENQKAHEKTALKLDVQGRHLLAKIDSVQTMLTQTIIENMRDNNGRHG